MKKYFRRELQLGELFEDYLGLWDVLEQNNYIFLEQSAVEKENNLKGYAPNRDMILLRESSVLDDSELEKKLKARLCSENTNWQKCFIELDGNEEFEIFKLLVFNIAELRLQELEIVKYLYVENHGEEKLLFSHAENLLCYLYVSHAQLDQDFRDLFPRLCELRLYHCNLKNIQLNSIDSLALVMLLSCNLCQCDLVIPPSVATLGLMGCQCGGQAMRINLLCCIQISHLNFQCASNMVVTLPSNLRIDYLNIDKVSDFVLHSNNCEFNELIGNDQSCVRLEDTYIYRALFCSNNDLNEVNLLTIANIRNLDISNNKNIEQLDCTQLRQLIALNISNTGVSRLDLKFMHQLAYFVARGCNFTLLNGLVPLAAENVNLEQSNVHFINLEHNRGLLSIRLQLNCAQSLYLGYVLHEKADENSKELFLQCQAEEIQVLNKLQIFRTSAFQQNLIKSVILRKQNCQTLAELALELE